MRQIAYSEDSRFWRIALISLFALFIAEIAQTTSLMFYGVGIMSSTIFIYLTTLNKNRIFDFIMVMYMVCLFPAQLNLGGLFPVVAFLCVIIHLGGQKKIGEVRNKDRILGILVFILILSSILGWLFVSTGKGRDLLIGSLSFSGIISLFYISTRIQLTPQRIKQFIKLNVLLAIYALMASVNTIFKVIPQLVAFPRWADEWIDIARGFSAGAGGIIGMSPLNGQHNLILAILFASFYFYSFISKKQVISKGVLVIGLAFAVVNIFSSISKAVFTALIFIIPLIYILQGKLAYGKSILQRVYQSAAVIMISFLISVLITNLDIGFVFERYQKQMEFNERTTGVKFSIETILDGTAINRSTAFEVATTNYLRRSWLLGYGWSTTDTQIEAYYGDNFTFLKRRGGSAHSQYFSTLFLFGWLGFIPFWLIHLRNIKKSFNLLGNSLYPIENRVFALACIGMVIALILHGVTADNTYHPGYFTSTMIIIGLGFSNVNSLE